MFQPKDPLDGQKTRDLAGRSILDMHELAGLACTIPSLISIDLAL